MAWNRRCGAWWVGVVMIAAAVGCGGTTHRGNGDGSVDGGVDGAVPECDVVPEFELGDADGDPSPLTVAPGQSRAGRLTEADIPTDPEGLRLWRAGDFVLANANVAMVIEDVGESDLYDPWGGRPLGMAKVADGKLASPTDYTEVLIGLERFTIATTSVTVMNDGTDGEPSVVRAVGPLRPIPFIDVLAKGFGLSANYTDIEGAIDYTLAPDSHAVTVRVSLIQTRPQDLTIRLPMHFFMQKSRMPGAVPQFGFDLDGSEGAAAETPYVAFVSDSGTSYVWESGDGPIKPFLDVSGTNLYTGTPIVTRRCEVTAVDWARVTVGGPGLDELLHTRSTDQGLAEREITGMVTEDDGTTAVAGVHVHAALADGTYLSRALTADDGSYTLHLPEGTGALTVSIYREGEAPVSKNVSANTATTDLRFAPFGWVHVQVTEARGLSDVATPAKVQLFATVPRAPASFGELRIEPDRSRVVYTETGDVTLRVPAGAVTVVASRGPEFTLYDSAVTVVAGETTEVAASIVHAVDSTDFMCADFHLHTNRSTDATDTASAKIRAAVADGLEVPFRSDHDWVAEFEPTIAALDLTEWAYGMASEELTTFQWGHMGVFPLVPDPAARNDGAIPWTGETPSDVFADVYGRTTVFGDPLLIFNHPRGDAPFQAYFDYLDYDPVTDTVGRMQDWDPKLRLLEVFNGTSFDANYCAEDENCDDDRSSGVNDWFSLINSALVADGKVFAVGSSDSHSVRSTPVGYPRTCLRVGVDAPADLRALGPEVLRDAVDGGHAVVSGGIFVSATTVNGGAGPGDTLTDANAQEAVHVKVQAPPWVTVDRLRVFVDGVATADMAVPAGDADDVVRFDDDIAVNVKSGAKGSWVVIVATGDATLEPFYSGTRSPFGVTNPIFFKR